MNTQINFAISPDLTKSVYDKMNKYSKNFIKKYGKFFKKPFTNRRLYIKINPSTCYDHQKSKGKPVLDYDVADKRSQNSKNFNKFIRNKLPEFYIHIYDGCSSPQLSYLYLNDKENFIIASQENFNKFALTLFCFLRDQDKFIIPPKFL